MDCSIVGVAARFGEDISLGEFWKTLREGGSFIQPMSKDRRELGEIGASYHWGAPDCVQGMYLNDIDTFDRHMFPMSVPAIMFADPRQRMFLEVCWRAIEDAGLKVSDLSGKRVGVFVAQDGWYLSSYVNRIPEEHRDNQEFIVPGNDPCFLANRVSFFFNFTGPSTVIDTTCSSVYVALDSACKSLQNGECDYAIVGGVSLFLDPWNDGETSATPFETSDSDVFSFSSKAAGYRTSEGCGAIVLQRHTPEIARQHALYGIVQATGFNSGGKTNSFAQPNIKQQISLFREVLNKANLSSDQINYIEAHGVASQTGDATEANALIEVFQRDPSSKPCYVSTIKPNIGHNHASSGIYALLKALLAFRYSEVPMIRGLNLEEMNSDIPEDTRGMWFLNHTADWPSLADAASPRYAFLTSYGFSNVNAAVVLREPENFSASESDGHFLPVAQRNYLICLSARTESQVQKQVQNLCAFLEDNTSKHGTEGVSCEQIAWTLNVGRDAMEHRWAAVVGSIEELRQILYEFIAEPSKISDKVFQGKDEKSAVLAALANDPSDLDLIVAHAFSNGNLAKVAALWCAGVDVQWETVWGQNCPARVSLPTYPFAQDRYWVPESTGAAQKSIRGNKSDYLHPFLHKNTSNFNEQRFSTVFSGDEFCLTGHVIHGLKVLPGVGHLELARAAAHQSYVNTQDTCGGSSFGLSIKTVVWANIIGVVDKPKLVHIRMIPQDDGDALYQLYSADEESKQEVVHNAGFARMKGFEPAPTLDIAALKSKYFLNEYSPRRYYDMYYALGLYMAPDYQGIEELYIGIEHVLAKLSLPQALESTRDQFVLHPCLMDGALLSSVGLLMGFGNLDKPVPPKCLIPFALDEIEFHDESSPLCWAWISYSTGSSSTDPFPKVDVDCCDKNGKVCVRFKGFSCRGLGDDKILEHLEEPYLLEPSWQAVDAISFSKQEKADYQKQIQVFCGFEDLGFESDARAIGQEIQRLIFPKLSQTDHSGEQQVLEVCNEIQNILDREPAEPLLIQVVVAESDDTQLYAGVSSALKSAFQQNANIIGQLIYSDTVVDLEKKLRAEASAPLYQDIRFKAGSREVLGMIESPSMQNSVFSDIPWRDAGVYLVVGGPGSAAKIIASDIASSVHNPVVVLASHMPDSQAVLPEVEGATITYREVEENEPGQWSNMIAALETEFGIVNGICYCVDALQAVGGDAYHSAILTAKALQKIDQATQNNPLDFFATVSSRIGVLGKAHFAAHAAIHAFADSFAVHRCQLVDQQKRFGQSFSLVLPWNSYDGNSAEGPVSRMVLKSLYRAFNSGVSGSVVAMEGGDIERFRLEMFGKRPHFEQPLEGDGPLSQPVQETVNLSQPQSQSEIADVSQLRVQAVSILKDTVSKIIQLPIEEVDEDALMEKYGIDSILSIKLTEELEKIFGVLSKTLFFEYLTISELADYFAKHFSAKLAEVSGANSAPSMQVKGASTQSNVTPLPVPKNRLRVIENSTTASTSEQTNSDDIAIVGLAGRYPQARTMEEFWNVLAEGVDCVTEIPEDRWDNSQYFNTDKGYRGTTYGNWGGFIDGVDEFDPLFFNLSPRDACLMSPQERLFLQCSYEAIQDAGYTRETLARFDSSGMASSVGVYAGAMYGEYEFYSVEEIAKGRVLDQSVVTGSFGSIANRVSSFLNLHGPSLAVDTMCSSSLTSIYLACQDLRLGKSAMAIAGGVNVSIHPNKYLILSQSKFLSEVGRCQAFGKGSEGYVPAEGVGVVVLKRLQDAVADNDHIYGVIKGVAINHGGKTNGYTVPNPVAQANAIELAIRESGVNADDISYVEAHGTGTSLGDPIEVAGLSRAFAKFTDNTGFCAIGSVKSNIGHCESAAGIAGLTKVLLQMKYKQLAPSLHCEELNPNIDFAKTPFTVQRTLSNWNPSGLCGEERSSADDSGPRTASISSFGAGGSNAHLVVQEYTQPKKVQDNYIGFATVLVPLSAKSSDQLLQSASHLANHVRTEIAAEQRTPEQTLRDMSYTLQVGRESMEERVVFVVDSLEDLLNELDVFSSGRATSLNFIRGQVDKARKGETPPVVNENVLQLSAQEQREGFNEIAAHWVRGVEIDWETLYSQHPSDSRPKKLSLPTYPFTREHYWVPTSEDRRFPLRRATETAKAHERLFFTCDWEKRATPIYDTDELGSNGSSRLTDVVILGSELENTSALKKSPSVRSIAFLDQAPDDFENFQAGLLLVLRRARELVEDHEPRGLVVLAPWLERGYPYLGLRGALRTIAMEYPQLKTKLVFDEGLSIGSSLHTVFAHLETEIRWQDAEDTVAYTTGGGRMVVVQKEVVFSENTAPPLFAGRESPVCLITGGLGGLGNIFARFFGERYGARLVLTGRSQLSPEKTAMLEDLRKNNISVDYVECDCSDESDLQRLVAEIQNRYGGLHGVVHCAGVLQDSLLLNKTESEVSLVLSAKVKSALLLDELTKQFSLDFFALFSSLASLGNVGQFDYASANSFLDNFAAIRSNQVARGDRSGKTVSINWPLWREGGMTVEEAIEAQMYSRFGIVPLDTATGIDVFEFAMNSSFSQLGVMEGDREKMSTYLRFNRKLETAIPETIERPLLDAQPLENQSRRKEEMVNVLLSGLSDILGMKPEEIDHSRNFKEYGMDSVRLAELADFVSSKFDGSYTNATLLDLNTIEKICSHVLEQESISVPQLSADTQGIGEPDVRDSSEKDESDALAIVGFDGRFPGADTTREYWQNLCSKEISIRGIEDKDWVDRGIGFQPHQENSEQRMKASGFLSGVDQFDAAFWNLDRSTASQMDPQQRLLMRSIWHCIEKSGYSLDKLTHKKVGLFVAVDSTEYKSMLKSNGSDLKDLQAGLSLGMMVNQISHFFNFTGPSEIVDNACASFYAGVKKAQNAMKVGDCDVAIVGAVKVMLDSMEFYVRDQGGIISRSGHMAPFDADADGYVRGEGVGCVFLKPLSQSYKDLDQVHAVVRAVGISHNGNNSLTSMTPSVDGQESTIRAALATAGIEASTVDYIEAHGSATQFNDASEIAAFKRVFRNTENTSRASAPCVVSTVKGNIGHLEAASGMAALIKVVLALKNKKIPPIASFSKLPPSISLSNSRLELSTSLLDWSAPFSGTDSPRRACLNSIGITGVNAHLVLEEAAEYHREVKRVAQLGEAGYQIVLVSAKSESALHAYLLKWRDYLRKVVLEKRKNTSTLLRDIAYSSQMARVQMKHRQAFVVSSPGQLLQYVEQCVEGTKFVSDAGLAVSSSYQPSEGVVENFSFDYTESFVELKDIAMKWVGSTFFNWQYFSAGRGIYIDIPEYPFQEERFWYFDDSSTSSEIDSFAILCEETF